LNYRQSGAGHASEHCRNGDAPVTENQRAWRLLAAMAGVALDANAEEAFFTQRRSPTT